MVFAKVRGSGPEAMEGQPGARVLQQAANGRLNQIGSDALEWNAKFYGQQRV